MQSIIPQARVPSGLITKFYPARMLAVRQEHFTIGWIGRDDEVDVGRIDLILYSVGKLVLWFWWLIASGTFSVSFDFHLGT